MNVIETMQEIRGRHDLDIIDGDIATHVLRTRHAVAPRNRWLGGVGARREQSRFQPDAMKLSIQTSLDKT